MNQEKIYYMFNKPQGCVTARSDNYYKTVMDYFSPELVSKLHPVGRLDLDTCGLLILTNDGNLDFKIMQPSNHISKTYFFYAVGNISDKKQSLLENGIQLNGFTTKPSIFHLIERFKIRELISFIPSRRLERYMKNPEGSAFSATLTVFEGKKHEVKRMLEAVGCKIFYLRRDSIGALSLDLKLKPGEYRELTETEIMMLNNT